MLSKDFKWATYKVNILNTSENFYTMTAPQFTENDSPIKPSSDVKPVQNTARPRQEVLADTNMKLPLRRNVH